LNHDLNTGLKARVDPEKCRFCGACASACPGSAIIINIKKYSCAFVTDSCTGCGACAAECRFGAISLPGYEDTRIKDWISRVLSEKQRNLIVSFVCKWCIQGEDEARFEESCENNKTFLLPCSGRASERLILYSFQKGAAIVLVCGCSSNECRHSDAVARTPDKIEKIRHKMKSMGIRPERLLYESIDSYQDGGLARIMPFLEQERQLVSPVEIESTRQILGD